METIKREGIDIIFAVDASKSMLAEDIAPNRLEKARRIISEIINELDADRIGVVAYAGQAHPQVPLTTDYSAARMYLQSINTDMLSSQGTALDVALDIASESFDDEVGTSKAIFIISDGEDHSSGKTAQAVERAVNKGRHIFAVGVGTPKGGRIPVKYKGQNKSYWKDKNGDVVITRLNEPVLANIARGNGAYVNGADTKATVTQIMEELDQLDKIEFESRQVTEYQDQFQWFLGIGLLFLIIDLFLLNRKTVWLKNINLFNEKA